jgi:hypothetical protein
MMSRQYYYDCPIAAAYMAKYFGVEMVSPRKQRLYWDGGLDFRAEKDCGIYTGGYYHVHPDSLHIFEPQVGDYAVVHGNMPAIIIKYENSLTRYADISSKEDPVDEYTVYVTATEEEYTFMIGQDKIIQRNNMPFLWPKEG